MLSDILTKPLQGQQFSLMRAVIMNCLVDYDETSDQTIIEKESRMMIPQNKSMISSQECVENNIKLQPTTLQLMEGPKIRSAVGSKIPLTWSQKEDTQRIPKMNTQAWTKKVRWSDMEKV